MRLNSGWVPWVALAMTLAGVLWAGATRLNTVEMKSMDCCQRLMVIDAKIDRLIYYHMEQEKQQR